MPGNPAQETHSHEMGTEGSDAVVTVCDNTLGFGFNKAEQAKKDGKEGPPLPYAGDLNFASSIRSPCNLFDYSKTLPLWCIQRLTSSSLPLTGAPNRNTQSRTQGRPSARAKAADPQPQSRTRGRPSGRATGS